MSQCKYKLVIFDWDGTLFDSVQQIADSLVWAAAQYQVQITEDAAKNIIGLGLPEAMQVLFPQHVELQPKIQAAYSQHYVASSHEQQWFAGVEGLFAQLKAANVPMAVATGKSRAGLDRVLASTQSADQFVITRCASETKSKPDPMMLEQILQHTGIAVEDAVMVGDTTYDLEMAANIGMPRIGVSYGVHSAEQLTQYQPITVVDTVAEVAHALF